jgi:glutathionylspermidine synthase
LYGILAEDDSDIETLKVLIRQLAGNEKLPIRGKGFNGCGELLKHGSKYLKSLAELKCNRFIVAHDADQQDVATTRQKLIERVIQPSGVKTSICLLVPTQTIEAWLLTDIEAVSKLFKSWNPKSVENPESISRPKEYLEKLSRLAGGRPRYSHATHNPQLAKHINLGKVSESCPSFRPLKQFVKSGEGNY